MRFGLAVVAIVALSILPGSASAVPCAPSTLQAYIALGATGCSVGPVTLSNFVGLTPPAGATAIAPASINVTPLGDGLQFGFGVAAAAGEFLDAFFGFQATDTLIEASLAIEGASATGDGVVTAIENLCRGAAFIGVDCFGDSETLIAFAIEGDGEATASVGFPAVSLLDVLADIGVDGGLAGTAQLESATFRFLTSATAVPEPPSVLLLCVAIAGLWLAHRRRRIR